MSARVWWVGIAILMGIVASLGKTQDRFCPSSEFLYYSPGDVCFKGFLSDPMTWHMAVKTCHLHGMNLAVIKSAEEQLFILDRFAAANATFWFNHTDVTKERMNAWEDGAVWYPNQFTWRKSRHRTTETDKSCGVFGASLTRKDCHTKLPFLCQIRDINPCRRSDQNECDQDCVFTGFKTYTCVCRSGYQLESYTRCLSTKYCDIRNGGCAHRCHYPAAFGRHCSCYKGFHYINDTYCMLEDPCQIENGGCEQTCTTLGTGRSRCSCRLGFTSVQEGPRQVCRRGNRQADYLRLTVLAVGIFNVLLVLNLLRLLKTWSEVKLKAGERLSLKEKGENILSRIKEDLFPKERREDQMATQAMNMSKAAAKAIERYRGSI